MTRSSSGRGQSKQGEATWTSDDGLTWQVGRGLPEFGLVESIATNGTTILALASAPEFQHPLWIGSVVPAGAAAT